MANKRRLAEIYHPGVFVKDEMETRGWSMETMVERSMLGREGIEEVIAGHRRVTPVYAHGLSLAFGTSKQMWMNLQKSYDDNRKVRDNGDE